MSETRLNISVVVIARNEEDKIEACLDSLLALDYPPEEHELIVVDNASTDATADIVDDYALKHRRLRRVAHLARGIAPARNRGLKEARHPFVAFIDADCTAERDWLSALERALREERDKDGAVAAAGGPNIPPEETTVFREAVAAAVTTYWGNHGSVQGAGPKRRCRVDHLPTLNVIYDKKTVLDAGGFDEGQGNISEDVELSHRLRWSGRALVFEPKAVVRHRWREDLLGWAKNMEVYGKGRSWLMKKDIRFAKPHHLAPAALVLATAAAPLCPQLPLAWAPALYAALTALASVYAGLKARRPGLIPLVFVVYAVTHYAYGLGQIHGLIAPRGSDIRRP